MAASATACSRRLGRARRTTTDESRCLAASASSVSAASKQPSQSLALASMIVGICGLMFGGCFWSDSWNCSPCNGASRPLTD